MSATAPEATEAPAEAGVRTVVGHDWAVELLSRQLAQERVAHAYLFTGPPQVGKGTLARWFAQALLCQGQGTVPCGRCAACRQVTAGTHPDLRPLNLEVQAGGRRTLGIEAVREVRSGIAERPFAGRRKVYLIEDAEAMTMAAANALLKTLEEPPPFAVLLLVALSDHLLPSTIVSRCHLLPLRPLSQDAVKEALVARWGAEEGQAGLLASLSHGRIGWAVQALQDPQLLSRRAEELQAMARLLEAGLLERFKFAEEQERSWRRGGHAAVLGLLETWQGWWRDLLLIGQGCPDLVSNLDQRTELAAAARRIGPETARRFLRALRAAQQGLVEQVNPRLIFEDLLLQLPAVLVAPGGAARPGGR